MVLREDRLVQLPLELLKSGDSWRRHLVGGEMALGGWGRVLFNDVLRNARCGLRVIGCVC
jgi:hypothetical protein